MLMPGNVFWWPSWICRGTLNRAHPQARAPFQCPNGPGGCHGSTLGDVQCHCASEPGARHSIGARDSGPLAVCSPVHAAPPRGDSHGTRPFHAKRTLPPHGRVPLGPLGHEAPHVAQVDTLSSLLFVEGQAPRAMQGHTRATPGPHRGHTRATAGPCRATQGPHQGHTRAMQGHSRAMQGHTRATQGPWELPAPVPLLAHVLTLVQTSSRAFIAMCVPVDTEHESWLALLCPCPVAYPDLDRGAVAAATLRGCCSPGAALQRGRVEPIGPAMPAPGQPLCSSFIVVFPQPLPKTHHLA